MLWSTHFAMAGKFELKKSKDDQFYFNLKASNGEIILTSERYKRKQSALNGIASVQKNATEEKRYEKRTDKKGRPYFVLKAANHQIIGQSEAYETDRACNNGIKSVGKNAPGAKLNDTTVGEA